jgi:tRNA (guanine37-N1)-methyltransferase
MLVQHRNGYVYFPISNIDTGKVKKLLEVHRASLKDMAGKRGGRVDYAGMLESAVGSKAVGSADTGYDSLGNIAVIDRKGMTAAGAKGLASCIMAANRSITTVLSKDGPVEGVYRTRRLRYVAGKRTFAALYRENSCAFEFDARRTFFSGRLAYERSRVAALARRDRAIMVMFAGVGPFAIEMAKANPRARVVAIELNPYAGRQLARNALLNKTGNVVAVTGDVKKLWKRYENFADRIVMPLPMSSTDFLDEAHRVARDGCTVHIYSFVAMDKGIEHLIGTIREHARANRYSVRVLFKRTVRNYSAREIEAVVDYRIAKRRG